jgi:hypothetical protein
VNSTQEADIIFHFPHINTTIGSNSKKNNGQYWIAYNGDVGSTVCYSINLFVNNYIEWST